MESLKELYRIGVGSSSSHSMGPSKAARIFAEKNPSATRFEVILYGSLAVTGKGYMTYVAIIDVLSEFAPVFLLWKPQEQLSFHPNAMRFKAYGVNDCVMQEWTVFSVVGGALAEETGELEDMNTSVNYSFTTLEAILSYCERTGKSYWEYVEECEEESLWQYLELV